MTKFLSIFLCLFILSTWAIGGQTTTTSTSILHPQNVHRVVKGAGVAADAMADLFWLAVATSHDSWNSFFAEKPIYSFVEAESLVRAIEETLKQDYQTVSWQYIDDLQWQTETLIDGLAGDYFYRHSHKQLSDLKPQLDRYEITKILEQIAQERARILAMLQSKEAEKIDRDLETSYRERKELLRQGIEDFRSEKFRKRADQIAEENRKKLLSEHEQYLEDLIEIL